MAFDMTNLITFISLLLVAVLLAGSVAVSIGSFQTGIADDLTLTQVVNETVVFTNTTPTALANTAVAQLTCSSVLANGTIAGEPAIGSANYTCQKGVGITVTLEGIEENGSVSVTYEYSEGDVQYNTTGNGNTGILNVSAQFGTIGTIVGIAVLIGIVILAFQFRRT